MNMMLVVMGSKLLPGGEDEVFLTRPGDVMARIYRIYEHYTPQLKHRSACNKTASLHQWPDHVEGQLSAIGLRDLKTCRCTSTSSFKPSPSFAPQCLSYDMPPRRPRSLAHFHHSISFMAR